MEICKLAFRKPWNRSIPTIRQRPISLRRRPQNFWFLITAEPVKVQSYLVLAKDKKQGQNGRYCPWKRLRNNDRFTFFWCGTLRLQSAKHSKLFWSALYIYRTCILLQLQWCASSYICTSCLYTTQLFGHKDYQSYQSLYRVPLTKMS